MEGSAVALAQPEDLDQCIGRPVEFRQATHRDPRAIHLVRDVDMQLTTAEEIRTSEN